MALVLGWGPVAAVALAGITWVSSSGVIAKMLHDLGRLTNRETPVILSVLVIEDLAMAFYLPILTALLVRMDLGVGTVSVLVALAAVFVILFVALRHGAVVSRLVWSKNAEVLLLSVLGLTILVAGVAAQVNASAAVGAFLVGIAISGPVAERAGAPPLTAARPVRGRVLPLLRALDRSPRPGLDADSRRDPRGRDDGHQGAHRLSRRPQGRDRRARPVARRFRAHSSRGVLHRHRGVAVASGIPGSLAALATGYVLITIIAGPILSRVPDSAGSRAGRADPGRPPRARG